LRRTLRGYLAAGGNVSSAAASLGLNRRTVSIHIRTAEERIGRPLAACAAEAELALKLQELDE
ncbi:MAG TPA: helix-turn-helix domain-containing protein, partial [Solirubrobacterales bacterium]|nr:helix-turn-helix domain-containing protein [Solirubrobacterales bacterium]